jgi:excisionase family DNA binding protein
MDNELIVIKISELKKMFAGVTDEIEKLRKEFQEYKLKDDTDAFTIKETASKLSLNYWTIRRLVKYRELQPAFLTGNSGHYRITAASIRAYLQKKNKTL